MYLKMTMGGRSASRIVMALIAALSIGVLVATDASAQRRNRDEEQSAEGRVFTPDVGEIVMAAQEKMGLDDYSGALADLNRAMTNESPSPYELGVILYMRGGIKYQLDDTSGALTDWNRALSEGDLTDSERLTLMYNIGQLYLSEGQYRTAVERLEEWIRLGGEATDSVHLNLVAAYVELGEWRTALSHARQAYQKANPRQKRHYDTLDYLYAELNMPAERADILSEAVSILPQERRYWLAIAQLHAEAGREQRAFEINKIMYLNGMLTTEAEIMRVVDYYSYYEVPYRGARILEREINAGRVERTQENLEKLARLYRQSNEFDRAIPPLEAAARMSPDGELFQTLGEAYYAEARLAEAENALLQAIDKEGIDSPGDVWVVIGNTRYERDDREGAIEAFTEAEQFRVSRDTAREWRTFVQDEIAAARNREQFKVDVLMAEHRVRCERLLTDRILYIETREEGDPDCIAIVDREDFSSVPEVIELQEAVYEQFGWPEGMEPTLVDGEDASVEGEDASEVDEASAEAAADDSTSGQ